MRFVFNVASGFYKLGKFVFKTSFDMAKEVAKVTTAAAVVSAGLNAGPPAVISTDFNDYAAAHNIDPTMLDSIAHQDIRVYHRYNPLAAIHMPGRAIVNLTERIYSDDNYAFDFFGEEGIEPADRAATTAITGAIAFPLMLLNSTNTYIASPFISVMAYALPASPDSTCYILPPGQADAKELVDAFTGIDEKYVSDDLNVSEQDVFTYIMLHEAGHCGQYNRGSKIDGETGADLVAAEKFIEKNGNRDAANLIMYSRAVGILSRTTADYDHATGAGMDAVLNGGEMPSSYQVRAASENLRKIIDERIDGYEGKRFIAVYNMMNDLLESGELTDPVEIRMAELYIEGVDYLAPSAVVKQIPVTPQPVQEQAPAFNAS